MCGILGYFFKNEYKLNEKTFISNLGLLNRRGPDNSDFCPIFFENKKIFFGHTRLSIIELTSFANQPFQDKNHILTYNGEIYNHKNLRNLFKKGTVNFESSSDTETLFKIISNHNIESVLNNIEGMFAFSFYDKSKRVLYLARDRTGEKPLYIFINKNCFGFSSDLITFKENPLNNLTINNAALKDYINLNYIPNPKTIYNECFKLPPGSLLKIEIDKFKFNTPINFQELINLDGITYKKWWKLKFNRNIYDKINYNKAKITTKNLIEEAVKKQLLSDAPLGAFLSSGVDSSLIVAIMQKIKGNSKTFTIGFDSKNFDESKEAKLIAKYLQTDHHEIIFSANDLVNFVDNIPKAYSEPFADSSQIPTLMISNLASSYVKVALSGDGGDEIFGGYNRYIIAKKYWKIYSKFPNKIKNFILNTLMFIPNKYHSIFLPKFFDKRNTYKIIEKLKNINSELSYYSSMINEWQKSSEILNFEYKDDLNTNKFFENNDLSFEKKMMLADFNTYLTDDILCKVDRASMFHSLETRAPYLDHNVSEFCFSLKDSFNFKNNTSKFLLKDILEDYIPASLITNKKRGFAIPISEWLNNELREWSNDYLTKDLFNKHDYFNYDTVENLKKFQNNNHHKIWALIQFNKWYFEVFKK